MAFVTKERNMKLAVAFVVALLCASPCFARDISSIVGNAICRISRDGETIESALGGIAKFPGAECLRCSCFGGILSCTDSGCEEYEHPKKCTPDFKRCVSCHSDRNRLTFLYPFFVFVGVCGHL